MPAVVVGKVDKKFGKPGDPFWKRTMNTISHQNGHNGKQNDHMVEDSDCNTAGSEAIQPANKSLAGARSKTKGIIIAVNYVSFTVEEGEVVGLLEPDGGGKSTLIRLISTLLLPDSGKIVALDTPAALKHLIPTRDGIDTTLEDVFLELTGEKLVISEESKG